MKLISVEEEMMLLNFISDEKNKSIVRGKKRNIRADGNGCELLTESHKTLADDVDR